LEAAYNVLSDLGEVSFRLARSGLTALKHVVPVPGMPVRMMLASRVHGLDEVRSHMRGDMIVEYKYDGERVQIHADNNGIIHAFSRRLERITHQYPELLLASFDPAAMLAVLPQPRSCVSCTTRVCP
jgi:DNA ligase-1